MSIQSETVALSLQEILLSISDSLNQAQHQLRSLPPYDEYGRLNTMYTLPYLDFNLQVTSEFETTVESDSNSIGNFKNLLLFRPMSKHNTSISSNQIVSTISGRFIATVPNEGVPQLIINYEITVKPKLIKLYYEFDLKILLSNSIGEIITYTVIEINYNEDKSNSLNETPSKLPSLSVSEEKTDATGEVSTKIRLPEQDFNNGNTFIFEINSGTVTKSISISK